MGFTMITCLTPKSNLLMKYTQFVCLFGIENPWRRVGGVWLENLVLDRITCVSQNESPVTPKLAK